MNGMVIFENISDAGSINLSTRQTVREKKHKRHPHKCFVSHYLTDMVILKR